MGSNIQNLEVERALKAYLEGMGGVDCSDHIVKDGQDLLASHIVKNGT